MIRQESTGKVTKILSSKVSRDESYQGSNWWTWLWWSCFTSRGAFHSPGIRRNATKMLSVSNLSLTMPLGRSKIWISTRKKSFRGLPESLIMTDHSKTFKSQMSAFIDFFRFNRESHAILIICSTHTLHDLYFLEGQMN